MGTAFQLNGLLVWGLVTELCRGLRLRLTLADWHRLGLNAGKRIQIRLPGRFDASLIVADVVKVPPAVWITLTHRVCNVRTGPAISSGRGKTSGHGQSSRRGCIESFPGIVQRLHNLVLEDQRYRKLGLGGLARVAFHEVVGRAPTADETREVVQDFWEFWHERYDKPQPQREVWASNRCGVSGEIAPVQENAIRVMEEAGV